MPAQVTGRPPAIGRSFFVKMSDRRQAARQAVLSRNLQISAKRQMRWAYIPPSKNTLINEHIAHPAWLSAALKSAAVLVALPQNWDTYGAPSIKADTIITGIKVLADVMRPNSPLPVFVPTSLGGCQLEWHTSRHDLEIEIAPGGDISVFFRDRQRGIEGEGDLATHLDTVKVMLREIV
jgi:hypothetical protein